MNKAVFLDRDGTVIPDMGYLDNIEGIQLSQANGEALAKLCTAGFLLVIISNQSGVGRGYFPEDMVLKQHHRLVELAGKYGAVFAGLAYCPHAPEDNCACRKPEPLMLQKEAERLEIDLRQSFMIGDKPSDILAGKTAGCKTILLGETPHEAADWTTENLPEAVSIILQPQLV